ncbi:MAG: outer membrane lipoprotein carrier protein LolA [Prevotella sp.]|nr:outer membrane lipoprotein carrier protein LolA [Prevotella sp.]
MKKIVILFSMLCLCISVCVAQQADYRKAASKYKNCAVVTAKVTKTAHKAALAKDAVTKGTLTMKAPNEVSIVIDGGKDQLLMRGTEFTMVVKGRKHATSSKKNAQFASFQTVFESILSGGEKDIAQLSDLQMSKQGSNIVLTIVPQAASKKAARRQLFSSFVLTIDTKTSELRSLRMNERGENYTEYLFSGFSFKK